MSAYGSPTASGVTILRPVDGVFASAVDAPDSTATKKHQARLEDLLETIILRLDSL